MSYDAFAISPGYVNAPTLVTSIVSDDPHVLDKDLLTILGPVRQQTIDGSIQRNGRVAFGWTWDVLSKTDFNNYIVTVYGGYAVASVKASIVTLDESGTGSGNWTWVYVDAERPVIGEHYTVAPGGEYLLDVRQNFYVDTVEGCGEFNDDFNFDFTV